MPRFPSGKLCPRGFVARALRVAVLCALPAGAASGPGDTLELPSTAARAAPLPAPEPATHRLDAASLRRFATLEDALASLPGFQVRRQGGLGGYSELSFRGARASAVEIYVDGMRLNQDGDGAPDLSKWPSLWFTSLEARTGFDARGARPGVLARIDLSTEPSATPGAVGGEAHARAGSFSVFEAAAAVHGAVSRKPAARWLWSAGLEGQTARNDYAYFDDNGTVYNPGDDAVRHMENNAYRSRGARATLKRETVENRQSFSTLWLDSRKEYPGFSGSGAQAYTQRTDWLGAWRLEHFGVLPWEAGLQGRRFDDAYHDPAQTLGYISFEDARVSLSLEGDARARLRALDYSGGVLDWTPQLRLRTESVEPKAAPFTQPLTSPTLHRHEAQAGSTLEGVFFRDASRHLSAALDLRGTVLRITADGARPFPDSGYGRIPVALRAGSRWNTALQSAGLLARLEQRAPSSGEILGDNNGVKGNRDLRAETTAGVSIDHALQSSPAFSAAVFDGRLQTTVFWNAYRNPIRLGAFGASAFLRNANAADYSARGIEWAGHASGRHAEGSLSLTVQDAVIDEGMYAGNRPAHQSGAEAHAELFWKPLPRFLSGARLGSLLDYRGPYDPSDANIPDAHRPAEWEYGAHASAQYRSARAAFDARNLTDRQYRDFAYSPRSGRNYAFTLSLTL
jgi:hypothetical protein